MTDETRLVLSGQGMPPYAVRGIKETLAPIPEQAQLRRTCNGEMDDVSAPQFQLYAVSITCTDQQAPAWARLWPGAEVTIDCVSELSYLTASSDSDGPDRPVAASREEGDYTFYRPRLTCRVTRWTTLTDEYEAEVGWQLDAVEKGPVP